MTQSYTTNSSFVWQQSSVVVMDTRCKYLSVTASTGHGARPAQFPSASRGVVPLSSSLISTGRQDGLPCLFTGRNGGDTIFGSKALLGWHHSGRLVLTLAFVSVIGDRYVCRSVDMVPCMMYNAMTAWKASITGRLHGKSASPVSHMLRWY